MRNLHTPKAICACMIYIFSYAPVDADFVSANDPIFGTDSVTIDTTTSLEWLDITLSVNRSYNDMIGIDGSNEFDLGGDFEGFRYASNEEMHALYENAGIPDIDNGWTVGNVTGVSLIMPLLGITSMPQIPDMIATIGITGNESSLGAHHIASLELCHSGSCWDGSAGEARATILATGGILDNVPYSIGGHWLVRGGESFISVPAAVWLFGSGLIGLIGLARRKARN